MIKIEKKYEDSVKTWDKDAFKCLDEVSMAKITLDAIESYNKDGAGKNTITAKKFEDV